MNGYNAEKFLVQALNSVLGQSYDNIEIIFYDNASTDKTAEIISKYTKKIRYFHSEVNLPLGEARAKAIECSCGKYIAFLDCDDLFLENKIQLQVECLETDDSIGLVYSDGIEIDEFGITKKKFSDVYVPQYGNIFNNIMDEFSILPVSAMIRRTVYNRVGPFLSYKMAEELDLFLKIAYQYKVTYINKTLFKYRWHQNNLSNRVPEDLFKERIAIKQFWHEKLKNSEQAAWMKIKFATAHWSYGSWLLNMGRSREARVNFKNSVQIHCTLQHLCKYLISFLPHSFSNWILACVRKYKLLSS